jgi:hypothetical protein
MSRVYHLTMSFLLDNFVRFAMIILQITLSWDLLNPLFYWKVFITWRKNEGIIP